LSNEKPDLADWLFLGRLLHQTEDASGDFRPCGPAGGRKIETPDADQRLRQQLNAINTPTPPASKTHVDGSGTVTTVSPQFTIVPSPAPLDMSVMNKVHWPLAEVLSKTLKSAVGAV
jgi:hypothetical protein